MKGGKIKKERNEKVNFQLKETQKRKKDTRTASIGMEDAELVMRRFVTEFRDGLYTYRDGKSAAVIAIYALLFVSSIVGNIAVLTLVLPFRRMRSVTHYFIINLAAADLLRTSLLAVCCRLS